MRRNGRVKMDARPAIVKQTPVSALVDGGGGLGHVPAHFAMSVAIDKAKQSGMAIAAVKQLRAFRRHRLLHADGGEGRTDRHGLHVGLRHPGRADLRQAGEARHRSLVVRRAHRRGEAVPARHGHHHRCRRTHPQQVQRGAAVPARLGAGQDGQPSTDPLEAREKGGFLTSLGGSPENSSYKGYGLAAMVNILASCLSGATLITDPMHTKKPQGMDIGHFFMAIDPGLFRDHDDFPPTWRGSATTCARPRRSIRRSR